MTSFVIENSAGTARLQVNSAGTARLQVKLYGSHYRKMTIHANFLSLEQPEFIDALERQYELEEIKKDTHGGMWLTCCVSPQEAATLMDDLAIMLDDTWRY